MLGKLSKEEDPAKLTPDERFDIKAGDMEEIRKKMREEGEKNWAMLVKAKIREAKYMQRIMGDRDKSEEHAYMRDKITKGIVLAEGEYAGKNWSNALSQIARISPDLMRGYSTVSDEHVQGWVDAVEGSAFMGDAAVVQAVDEFKSGIKLTEDKKAGLQKAAAEAKKPEVQRAVAEAKTPEPQILETPFVERLVDEAQSEGADITPFVEKLAGVLGDKKIRSKWDDTLVRSMPTLSTGAAVHLMEKLQRRGGDKLVGQMTKMGSTLNQLTPAQVNKLFKAIQSNPRGVNITKLVAKLKQEGDTL